MFIIANDGDGYGIDRCLASGDKCGAAVANAYCKTHEFAQAASYRKVDRDDITGAIPSRRLRRLPRQYLRRRRHRLHALDPAASATSARRPPPRKQHRHFARARRRPISIASPSSHTHHRVRHRRPGNEHFADQRILPVVEARGGHRRHDQYPADRGRNGAARRRPGMVSHQIASARESA